MKLMAGIEHASTGAINSLALLGAYTWGREGVLD